MSKSSNIFKPVCTGRRPESAWFLKIAFVWMSVHVCVCVCVCVCLCVRARMHACLCSPPRLLITSGLICHDIKTK